MDSPRAAARKDRRGRGAFDIDLAPPRPTIRPLPARAQTLLHAARLLAIAAAARHRRHQRSPTNTKPKMTRNAQLDVLVASNATNWDSYHSPMEGNRPLSAPHGPPPPWPPYYRPASPAGRWIAAAIIGAALIVAAAIISAVVLSRATNAAVPTAPTPNASGNVPAQARTGDADATCAAWRTTKPALDAIPGLPAGWDWSTPNIDIYISNHNAAVARALDVFEPEIATEPADSAAAAHEFVSARRDEIRMLADHTYTQADGVPGSVALARLNQLCGVS
ncbi:hypothetical protein MMARE11_p00980 (plasmid) [Mycobacterium marinum E11]|nr:hypothetical protein MMARE11_p00980 [Mycobacterium marinum E11]